MKKLFKQHVELTEEQKARLGLLLAVTWRIEARRFDMTCFQQAGFSSIPLDNAMDLFEGDCRSCGCLIGWAAVSEEFKNIMSGLRTDPQLDVLTWHNCWKPMFALTGKSEHVFAFLFDETLPSDLEKARTRIGYAVEHGIPTIGAVCEFEDHYQALETPTPEEKTMAEAIRRRKLK